MRKKIINTLKEKSWSVNKLHEETGIRYKSLHDFLKNDKGIGFENLQKIVDCLGLSLSKK